MDHKTSQRHTFLLLRAYFEQTTTGEDLNRIPICWYGFGMRQLRTEISPPGIGVTRRPQNKSSLRNAELARGKIRWPREIPIALPNIFVRFTDHRIFLGYAIPNSKHCGNLFV